MPRHLNLVKNDFANLEKRVLPRFPFCYLTFKTAKETARVYEVKDISYSGMQLSLKEGKFDYKEDHEITGNMHWSGRELNIFGTVKWVTDNRLGVEFSHQPKLREEISDFLTIEKLALMMKPIHKLDFGVEIPARLKFWLRADGPVELFVWQHADGELSKFQILLMENFVEWEDGLGLKSGRVMSKRNIDTPLISEDEFVFDMDSVIDQDKIDRSLALIEHISDGHLSTLAKNFIRLKLRS